MNKNSMHALNKPGMSVLDGVSDTHRGIHYTWVQDGTTKISFEYHGTKVVIDTGKQYNVPGMFFAYQDAAKWFIDDYIESVEWEKLAEQYKDTIYK